eukprot:gnl/Hemi2/17688_TR5829_c0_g1_i1.p1 gnl/Hemi2/17688_TR5829_c0_g1~~gnl/Hemi2/17688_TR5829_c0_g1_i1.p1  ORF type:complete len:321 (+),score=92.06 gnl/Hemi2/17688_TR5829_c0_g1_i1:66-965(+)
MCSKPLWPVAADGRIAQPRVKCVVVGDRFVGKTALLRAVLEAENLLELQNQRDETARFTAERQLEIEKDHWLGLQRDQQQDKRRLFEAQRLEQEKLPRQDLVSNTSTMAPYTPDDHRAPTSPVHTIIKILGNPAQLFVVERADYAEDDVDRSGPLLTRPVPEYAGAHCFLLCYSAVCRESFDRVSSKWYPELKHHAHGIPVFLVCTQLDMYAVRATVAAHKNDLVTEQQGIALAKKIGAAQFWSCSSPENARPTCRMVKCFSKHHSTSQLPGPLSNLFYHAVQFVLALRHGGSKTCSIL